ncbi:hypothetical protein [Herbaspirillum huttiense]|uniref:hypothetical protein n=1 Tax=Herbaspirillum huttiense TaxID=863372 RepID=UPI0039AF5A35
MIQKMKQHVPGHREFGTTLHLRNSVILAKARIYGGSRRMMETFCSVRAPGVLLYNGRVRGTPQHRLR